MIVDDADHLKSYQLHWLAEQAATTNTKLLLITTPDHRQPAHTLTAALDHLLPWAQHLGTPDSGHQRTRTAIERADHHLTAAQSHTGSEYQTARELLQRRDQLLDHFDEMRRVAAQLDTIAARHRARSRSRSRSRDAGLEL